MKRVLIALLILISGYVFTQNNSVLIEAESFASKGGWVVDPQFVEQMGSPYFLAHGMDQPENIMFQFVPKTGSPETVKLPAVFMWLLTENNW